MVFSLSTPGLLRLRKKRQEIFSTVSRSYAAACPIDHGEPVLRQLFDNIFYAFNGRNSEGPA
jgi:hypothetical protein